MGEERGGEGRGREGRGWDGRRESWRLSFLNRSIKGLMKYFEYEENITKN